MIEINKVLPSAITILRIIMLPLFLYSIGYENKPLAIGLFSFLIFTDLLDGYIARKLEVSSKWGLILDFFADAFLIFSSFTNFVEKGFYAFWVLILVSAMFVQFLATSYFFRKIYDPIGKHYGTVLYGGIWLTLAFSERFVYDIFSIFILWFSIITMISRMRHLLKIRFQKSVRRSPQTE